MRLSGAVLTAPSTYGFGVGVRFEVLGPVRAYGADGQVVPVPRLERMLLATLLLNPDRVVPVGHLVDTLWGPGPPQRARNQVQKCVHGLRNRLARAGVPSSVLVTDVAGYQLRVPPDTVDLQCFRSLLTQARSAAAADRPGGARDYYRAALNRWHGPALAGVDGAVLQSAADALEEERARATEECLQAELAAGGAGELAAELTDLVQRHPYREGLHAALMTALYRAGRTAEALAAYRRARTLLREDLGTEPGEQLRRLHRAVLRRDPALEVAGPAPRAAPMPRELPPEPRCFVGRESEAARVAGVLLSTGSDPRRRPAVMLLYGPGGVGKSALAARVGHELAGSFPDGQVYVDLCGSTPGMRPVPAPETLGRLLRSLGVGPREVPSGQADAAALLRSVTADRRLLMVLDNAADADQVAPVLPAAGSCGVLVTSRHPLPVLDVDDRLRLEGLPEGESVELLAGLAGQREVEPEAARAIVAATGGLPLGIRVAGGRLAARPDLPAAEYADRLADRSRRLDELALDLLDVRSCITVGYDALRDGDPAAQLAARAFRALGVLHVPDVAPGVVAAMLDEPDVQVARSALDRLVAVQLLEAVPGGRYRLHDLVRLVATERARAEDSRTGRDAALERAIAFYIGALRQVEDLRRPGRKKVWGEPPLLPATTLPAMSVVADARVWVDAELRTIVAAFEQECTTTQTVTPQLVWFGGALWDNLDRRCEWLTAHRMSVLLQEAAERADASGATGFIWLLRARSEATVGETDVAVTYFQRSLSLMRQSGNEAGVALVYVGLGRTLEWRRDPRTALRYYGEALTRARREKLQGLTASIVSNMSVTHARLGQLHEALTCAGHAAALSRSHGELQARGSALNNLAGIHGLRGEYGEALDYVDQALSVGQETGDRLIMCEGAVIRSEINRRRGVVAEASIDVDNALARARESGYGYVESAAERQRARLRQVGTVAPPTGYETSVDGHRPRRSHHPDSMVELFLSWPEHAGTGVLRRPATADHPPIDSRSPAA